MTWTSETPILSIQNVHKSFGDLQVLKGVSIDVMKGEVICIIGPSGSGKSTLIRCVNGLNDIQSGSIKVKGTEVHDKHLDKLELRRNVGMVFQQYNLFPHKTAIENIMMAPIKVLKQPKEEVRQKAMELLRKVRLEGKEESYPGELSGGQQQRLCIARAIAVSPEVILMDEPCSALDPIATARIEELIHELSTEFTIVIVTHSMQQAARVSQRTAYFHLGKLVEVGETEQIFTKPQHEMTHNYITGRFG